MTTQEGFQQELEQHQQALEYTDLLKQDKEEYEKWLSNLNKQENRDGHDKICK